MLNDDEKYYILKDADGKETRRILKNSPEGERLTNAIKERVALQKMIDEATDYHPIF